MTKRALLSAFACTVLFVLPLALLPVTADDPPAARGPAAALQPFVDSKSLAGAVTVVADKDKILSHEAVGFSDIAAMILMPLNALFWIASQSKPITAAALMILVDEGKVSLDDPVEKYLPEFKGQQWVIAEEDKDHRVLRRPKHAVTVREVLSHTSGMPFASAMERPTLDLLPLRDAVRSYAITPLNFEPGTKYAYSNAGINTAGRIIEVAGAMPYEDFLDKRLFGPLGMKDTTFWPSAAQLKRLAKAYRPGKGNKGLEETTIGQLQYPLSDRKRQPMPAGGLFSTGPDVVRFCQMMLGGGEFQGKRILSVSAVKEMTKRQTGEGIKESYGLGWSVGAGSYGHGGALSTGMNIDTKRGLITIFLVQHAGFPGNGNQAQGMFRKAAEEQFGRDKN